MADITGAPYAALLVLTITSMCLLVGLVILKVLNEAGVQQSMSAGEAVALVAGLLVILAATLLAWGTWLMPWPSALAAGGWFGLARFQKRQEWLQEQQHWLGTERRARAMLAADPTATVALSQLAQALDQLGRRDEALDTLREWHRKEPWNPDAVSRLNRWLPPTEAPVGLAPKPVEQAELRPARDLGGGTNEPESTVVGRLLSPEQFEAAYGVAPGLTEADLQAPLSFDPDQPSDPAERPWPRVTPSPPVARRPSPGPGPGPKAE